MNRLLLAASAALVLSACQGDPDVGAGTGAPAAEDAASEASASSGAGATAAGDASAGSGMPGGSGGAAGSAPEATRDPIGMPPPINGSSGASPADTGGTVRPEMGARPPEAPTTETLARPETPMPQTTPDGRPAF